jgi:MoaA/NifB/PqqE/SkfB family radical SAM enzyme
MSRASNNRCRFCNDAPFQDGTFWPFDTMARMIDEGIARGVRRVFLSGGEPTIHPRFLDVIRYAKQRGAERVIVITNGRMFAYREFAERAVRLGLTEAFVALLGKDAETHDYLTQVDGSFEQTTRGIENLLATGRCRVSLSCVATRRNLHQLSEISTLIDGVTGLTAVRVSPAGRALFESLDELGFELDEARPHIAEAFRTAARRGLSFLPKLFPFEVYEGREHEYVHHEEYLPEIKDTELRTGLFGAYAAQGREIACRGATCRVCYRAPFCDALYRFRERLVGGSHTWVRCDLEDPVQVGMLAGFVANKKLWLRAERAGGIGARLAALGLELMPDLVECVEHGPGETPRTRLLVLREDAALPAGARLDVVDRLGVHPVEGADCSELSVRADLVVVPTHERFRNQQRLGVYPARAVARGKPVAGLPPCLASKRFDLPDEEDVLELGALRSPTEIDVVGFTHHFLRNLHRSKSQRCGDCVERSGCRGLHVNQGRQWGLARLTPIHGAPPTTNEAT